MLIAHWPLNGNANDISGNGYNLTTNNGSYTNGKIGQAYLADASNEYLSLPSANNSFQNIFNNNFSISFWYNANIGTENTNRAVLQYGAAGIDTQLHLLIRASGNYFAIGFYGDDYNSSFVPALGVWNHYTIIGDKNNSKQKLYINGIYYGERTTTGWLNTTNSIFYIAYYAGYYANGPLNDVRIYDHVLTDFDIQEIARAKILYYTFDDMQEPTTNILPYPNFENRTYETPYTATAWGGDLATITYYQDGGYNNLPYYHLVRTADGTGGTYHDNHSSFTLEEGKTYTISAYIKSNQDSYWANGYVLSFNRISDNLYLTGPGVTLNKEWQRYSFTKTITTDQAGVYWVRNIVYEGTDTEFYWSGIQVEEKPYATEYVVGDRSEQINDYSGFFNHSNVLTDINTPKWITDSKIGIGAYEFNGSTSVIERPMLSQLGYNSFTVNMWAWFDESGTRDIPFGNFSSTNNFNFEKYTNNNLRFYWNASPDILTGNVIPIGQWCMITAVRERLSSTSSIIKMYVNGNVIYNQTATVNDLNSLDGILRLGRDYRTTTEAMKGKLDDVRVYMTALSDEDVYDLYETRAEIEEDGVLYAKNFLSNCEETVNMHGDPTMTDQYTENAVVTKSNWGVDGTLFARKNTAPEAPEDSLMLELNITSGSGGGLYTDLSRYNGREYILEEGKTYTRSWWAKCSDTRIISGHMCSSNRGDGNIYLVGGAVEVSPVWKKYSHTFTVSAGQGGLYHTRHIIYNYVFSLWVANFQIEEKSYYTPFTIDYRLSLKLPSTIEFGADEIHETGIANYEDFSTAGIVDGLVGFWQFDKDVKDYSGNDIDAINYGAISDGTSYRTINTSYIALPWGDGIDPSTTPFSVVAKIKYNTMNSNMIISTGQSPDGNARFYVGTANGTRMSLGVYTSWWNDSPETSIAISNNTWYLVSVIFSGTDAKLYINNNLVRTLSYSSYTLNRDIYLGVHDSNYYADASYDYFKLFNRALSAEEISIEYNTMVKNEVQVHNSGKVYAKALKQY